LLEQAEKPTLMNDAVLSCYYLQINTLLVALLDRCVFVTCWLPGWEGSGI